MQPTCPKCARQGEIRKDSWANSFHNGDTKILEYRCSNCSWEFQVQTNNDIWVAPARLPKTADTPAVVMNDPICPKCSGSLRHYPSWDLGNGDRTRAVSSCAECGHCIFPNKNNDYAPQIEIKLKNPRPNISLIRDNAAHASLKLALASTEIAYAENDEFVIKDRKLHEMINQAQNLCNEICKYIDSKRERKWKSKHK